MPSPVNRSSVAVFADELADGGMIFVQDRDDFFRLRTIGKRGEAAQIEEDRGDLAPMDGSGS